MASGERKWWVLAALVPVALALNFDVTVLSLALPTLAGSLHATTSDLQWFATGYMLVFAAAMIPGGMLGDRYGRKQMLLLALVVFGAGSAACAAAPSAGWFLAARLLLGLGAALATPLTIGVLPALFDDEERQKAVAAVMSATMLAYPLGPILGGWMLTRFWWGWVFLLNLPIVALAVACVLVFLPETRSSEQRRIDLIGVGLSSAGLAIVSYGVIEAGPHGWGNRPALVEMLAGAALLAAFVGWERRVPEPLLDLDLFRSRGFTWGTILATVVSFALIGLFFAMPLYFQEVLGANAMGSGIRLLPMIGGLLVGAGVGAKLAQRLGPRLAVGIGFGAITAGLGLGATTSLAHGAGFAAAWLAIVGFGTGFAMPTTINAALGALTPDQAGVGSGTVQALRMVGSSFGAAILGSILNAAYRGRLDLPGYPATVAHAARDSATAGTAVAERMHSPALLHAVQAAYVHGLDMTLIVSAAIAAAGVVLALAFLPGRTKTVADEDIGIGATGEGTLAA